MTLGSARLLNGALLGLLVAAVAAACGSDDGKKTARDAGGGASGDGGAKPIGLAGERTKPEGGGGQPVEVSAGQGGMPPLAMAGEGGVPVVIENGGAPAAGAGGAGGSPDVVVLPPVNCDPVTFADNKLEDAVRTALDKSGPLTLDDMASLTTLNAAGYAVADLSGIECFTEITDLNLGYGGSPSKVTNFTPLRYLQKLNKLNLTGNAVQTLEPLGELPNLQRLILSNAVDAVSLTPLAKAPALVRLDLDSNELGDLTPLGSIATLREVWFTSTKFTAPNSLSALTQVERLYVGGTQLADATPLAGLTQLTELTLNSNANLANFNALSTLVNLTRLDAASTGISSATAIGSMTKLTHLDLYFDNIADISPLQGLLQLQTLALNSNPVTDIAPLVANTGLGAGDFVYLPGTSLNCQAGQAAHVATLIGRGVSVTSPCN
jgi:hypothetical protein